MAVESQMSRSSQISAPQSTRTDPELDQFVPNAHSIDIPSKDLQGGCGELAEEALRRAHARSRRTATFPLPHIQTPAETSNRKPAPEVV
jgi:hypothetical protein